MSKLINLAGQRFGFWLVKMRVHNHNKIVQWLCLCDCGKEKIVTTNSLRSGNSTSCGCNHCPDLTGLVFGSITVSSLNIKNFSKRYWNCQCTCGLNLVLTTNQIRNKTNVCQHLRNFKKEPTSQLLLLNKQKLLIEQQAFLIQNLVNICSSVTEASREATYIDILWHNVHGTLQNGRSRC
jgi:hypothetical protein